MAHRWEYCLRVALGAAVGLTVAASADAAYDSAQLKCRSSLAKQGTKLASAAHKAIATCHRLRLKGVVSESTDCNDLAQADTRGKVERAEDALARVVGVACTDQVPAELGYTGCPFPCHDDVPSLDDMGDVGSCTACLVRSLVSGAAESALGSPGVPLAGGSTDLKCHSTIAKQQSIFLSAILKERVKCQTKEEREGAIEIDDCEAAPTHVHLRHGGGEVVDSKLALARIKAATTIQTACSPVDPNLAGLDTCTAGISVTALSACVLDLQGFGIKRIGEGLFAHFYGLEYVEPLTWTEIYDVFGGIDSATNCGGSGCHLGMDAEGGLNMSTKAGAYAALVGASATCSGTVLTSLVLPGDSFSSFLAQKIDHVSDCGSHMPLGKAPLDDEFRARVRAWIDEGAPEN